MEDVEYRSRIIESISHVIDGAGYETEKRKTANHVSKQVLCCADHQLAMPINYPPITKESDSHAPDTKNPTLFCPV